VGHTGIHVVPGGRSQVGQRGHSILLAVLPSGRLADTHRQVAGRAGDVGRRRGRVRRRVLRGQPEPGQPENVRPGAARRLPGARHIFPFGRVRVAVPHPERHQATGRPE